MNRKILVVGNGWLGNKIKEYLDCELAADIIKTAEDIERIIKEYQPEIIINGIGITGSPNIDWCEDHKEETYFGNVKIPVLLAEACQKHDIKLVHLSSGCIYQGAPEGREKPGWTEEDKPNFEDSYYSYTKAEAERQLADYDNIIITRIRMPIDKEPSSRDLLTKLLGYQKIINLPNSVTVIDDYLKTLKGLIEKDLKGTFNCVNKGTIRHQELIEMYEEETGQKTGKEYVNELDNIVAPRSNCILNTKKLENLGLALPNVLTSVRKQVEEYVKNEK